MELNRNNVKNIAKKVTTTVVTTTASTAAAAVSMIAAESVMVGINANHYNKMVSGLSKRQLKKTVVDPMIGSTARTVITISVGGAAFIGTYSTMKSKIDVIDKINDINLEDLDLDDEDQEELRRVFGEDNK